MRRARLIFSGALGAMAVAGTAAAQTDMEALRALANRGDAVAEYKLGMAYGDGVGVPKDSRKAYCWIHRSAERGYITAWLVAGMQEGTGNGGPRDLVEAYKWFYLTDWLLPSDWPAEIRAYAKEDMGRIAPAMSRAQIEEAKTRARAWWAEIKTRGPHPQGLTGVPTKGPPPTCE